MKITKVAIALLSTGIIFSSTNVLVAKAVQFPDGRVAFEKSPLLLDAISTFNTVRMWGATYYFTVELPADAGEPLQKIVINQRQGADDISFRLERTVAYKGTHRNKQEKLTLETVSQDEETEAITVNFAEPIAPGTIFTVGLKPRRNPDFDGIYLFGVTAFPTGEKPDGLYLGVGRLQFFRGDGDGFVDP